MNKIQICFDLIETYNNNLKKLLKRNKDITEENLEEIFNALKNDENITISLNKKYEEGKKFEVFCKENNLNNKLPKMLNFNGHLYAHQERAIKSILDEKCTIISTGTGSGKTESFLIPILNYCMYKKGLNGIKSIIIYPMNALASDQLRRIEQSVKGTSITYALINGDVKWRKDIDSNSHMITRDDIIENPPDILVTNYVMLERMLTNPLYNNLFVDVNHVFKYIVLDEIHIYNGNKALNIKYLLHRLRYRFKEDKIVQIGCSATLDRNSFGEKTGGYITGKKEVDEFIKKMFDVKEGQYKYIQPTFSREDIIADVNDDKYQELANNKIVKLLKKQLFSGSKTLKEILNILKNNKINLSKEELKLLLNEIVNMNQKYPEKPILDFRIHIFFLERGSILKRCCKCGKYYTSYIDKCNDCGNLVFPVYGKDPNLLMGQLEQGFISSAEDNSDDKKCVLLNFNSNKSYDNYENKLRFTTYENDGNKIKLDIDKDGIYQVIKDTNFKYKPVELLKEDDALYKTNLEYLLIKRNLMDMPNDKKILTFIDNRERAGRNKNLYNDFFFSDCYDEILKLVINGHKKSLAKSLNEGINLIEEYSENSDCKDINVFDFKCWFFRYIKTEGKQFSELDTDYSLSKIAKEIYKIALEEGLYFYENLTAKSNFIKIKRFSFIKPKGLKIGGENERNESYLALTPKAIKYKDFCGKYDEKEIKEAVTELVNANIFVTKNNLYYLNLNKILLCLDKSIYSSIGDIVKNIQFKSGVHSSEVDIINRSKYENEFQNGKLQLLFTTPTLEMGIDIGKLSFVYMFGVPPVPSNYSQRAGRAGRRDDKFAAIITMCSETNGHDWYYFHNPKEIIEGTINPPRFNLENKIVLNKHINTLIYVNSKILSNMEQKCEEVFNCKINMSEHIQLLKKKLDSVRKKIDDPYKCSIYPDYDFSPNVVKLYDQNSKDDNKKIIATRELEMGYKSLTIGRSMFIGNSHYVLEPMGDKTFIGMNSEDVTDIKEINCKENENYIKIKKESNLKNCYLNIITNKKNKLIINKKAIQAYYIPEGVIQYITKYFYQNETYGYTLKTNIILFKFQNDIISKKQKISMMALLHKSVMKEFGLDSSELAINADEEINVDFDNSNCSYAILYDKKGTENFDLEVILNAINNNTNNFMDNTYNIISNCKCKKSSGCYLCMKSFETQYLYEYLDKYCAKNMIGYLMNRERLIPSIIVTKDVLYTEAQIILKQKNNFILNVNGNDTILENKQNQNETIFFGLYRIIKELYEKKDIQTIVFKTNLEYVINAINELNKCKDSESINLFYFYKQAFIKFETQKNRK